MAAGLLHLLFFLSGTSGLIYQVVWVRSFGNVFGNSVYSASIVVALFMLGLGAGSYAFGRWADREYAGGQRSLLRMYGVLELLIAAAGATISLILPRLAALSALASAYVVDERGWHVMSAWSYAARAAIAFVLVAPMTFMMGGTLTLLIRHRVRRTIDAAGRRRIAVLYAVNTAGAAAGAFLTDFLLVPALGLLATQFVAVGLNAVAGAGAIALARALKPDGYGRLSNDVRAPMPDPGGAGLQTRRDADARLVPYTALALALCGFAAMGVEILWLRHFTILLGGFRAVFSLLLTTVLAGIAAGSLLAGLPARLARPAELLILVQSLFAVTVLAGLRAGGAATSPPAEGFGGELWFNLRPMLLETAVPSLLMGCSFPLGNAIVQRVEAAVGARAGLLYFANTAGAIAGATAAGYVLLPLLGLQASAAVLALIAVLAAVPLWLTPAPDGSPRRGFGAALSVGLAAAAVAAWFRLPPDEIIRRALPPGAAAERTLVVSEGVTELVAVTEIPGRGRGLITNGHPMASTAPLDQRYMRALAHLPLLAMERPARVLVIGFGVGNSTHAASLHPSIERIEVVDLSRHILEHAGYFRESNGGVLERVAVYVNDGRQHLHMQRPGAYDLITLEPPPIAHAGVGALYAREFYALARSRLAPGGYLSQWLPAYQVPGETSLAMVRAFVDVFPQAVLLSGMQGELLLMGTTGDAITIDPARLAEALRRAPPVQADLSRLDLGTPTEIVGAFVASAATLVRATRQVEPVSDDRPLQEYGVRAATARHGVPAALFDLAAVDAWCPRCFEDDRPAAPVAGLDTYLTLLDAAYRAPPLGPRLSGQRILGSAYLAAVVPDSPEVHYEIGSALLDRQEYEEAARHFEATLRASPRSAAAHNDLGVALASIGHLAQAVEHFREAVNLEPGFAQARANLESALQQLPRLARQGG